MDAVIEAVASKIDRRRVRGIGISGQQHGLVALDDAGSVIRPAKLWSDTSTVEECRILTKKLAGRRPAACTRANSWRPRYLDPALRRPSLIGQRRRCYASTLPFAGPVA